MSEILPRPVSSAAYDTAHETFEHLTRSGGYSKPSAFFRLCAMMRGEFRAAEAQRALERLLLLHDGAIETRFTALSPRSSAKLPFEALARLIAGPRREIGLSRFGGPPIADSALESTRAIMAVPNLIVAGVDTPQFLGGHTPMSADGYWLEGLHQGGPSGRLRERFLHWQAAAEEERAATPEFIFVAIGSGQNEFYPFLIATLPSLFWYRALRLTVPILLPRFAAEFQPALVEALDLALEALEIPRDRLLDPEEARHRRYAFGLIPAPFGIGADLMRFYRHFVLPRLREKGRIPAVSRFGTRLYISRQGVARRRMTNEQQVIDMVGDYGYRILRLQDLSMADQVAAFHSARSIIAPHGAGLTNLLFAQAGTRVLELMAKGTENFREIARLAGLQFERIATQAPPAPPRHEWTFDDFDRLRDYCEKASESA